jgi:hypothetical protein
VPEVTQHHELCSDFVTVYLSADRPLTQVEIGEFVERLAAVRGVASPRPPRVAADGRTADVPSVLGLDPFAAEAPFLTLG